MKNWEQDGFLASAINLPKRKTQYTIYIACNCLPDLPMYAILPYQTLTNHNYKMIHICAFWSATAMGNDSFVNCLCF